MKKSKKVLLIILIVFVIIVLADTIQAKVFNNRPLIKITENYSGGNVYQRDNGILVYTYIFSDRTKKTVFRWEKYAPPMEVMMDLQKNNNNFVDTASDENSDKNEGYKTMENVININVSINSKKYNATIENNETAKNFISQLPQEFNMKELNENEKYVYMDNSLPTNPINPNHIKSGDIMLYGSDCLVIFYKSFDTKYSYTKIGHIDNLPDLGNDNVIVKFEK